MNKLIRITVLAAISMFAGCAESPPPFEPQSIAVPTLGDSSGPRLASGPDSELLLSWMESGDDGATVRYSRFLDGAWGTPDSVVENAPLFVNWADFPSVVPLGGEHLGAHWLQKSEASGTPTTSFLHSLSMAVPTGPLPLCRTRTIRRPNTDSCQCYRLMARPLSYGLTAAR